MNARWEYFDGGLNGFAIVETGDQTTPRIAQVYYEKMQNGKCEGYAVAEKRARLIAVAPELVDALNGLYGLLQLFASRDDVPPEVKNFATNHRAVEALAVLAKVES